MATTMRSSLPDSSSDLSGDAKRDSILKSNEQARLPIGKVGLFCSKHPNGLFNRQPIGVRVFINENVYAFGWQLNAIPFNKSFNR